MDRIPDATGATTSGTASPIAAGEALRLAQTASIAWLSLVANRVLEEQVRNAHAWGDFLREQSAALSEFSGRISDPAAREALAVTARIGAHAGGVIVEAAVEWGRRHGHLAFAVPPTASAGG